MPPNSPSLIPHLPDGGPPPVLRFAPSPNGELHLGHALSALIGFALAQRHGGRFLVRIEDIDVGRSRPELIAGIFRDLAWLGIRWEEPVLRQSEHFAAYRAAADRLADQGLLYPCFATRAEIAAAANVSRPVSLALDPDGAPLYPDLHKGLPAIEVARRQAAGEAYALRIDMARAIAAARARLGIAASAPLPGYDEIGPDGGVQRVAIAPERWGDAVIVRKDVPASYHLAVVVDDARQAVTHVTRGRDLMAATDLHRLLQILLGLEAPLYHHHRLIADADGRKLAKSARDTSLRQMREDGATPADIHRLVGLIWHSGA